MAGHPKNNILTCDAFGVLPPVSKLTPTKLCIIFLSGYTAKVAGTERGVALNLKLHSQHVLEKHF